MGNESSTQNLPQRRKIAANGAATPDRDRWERFGTYQTKGHPMKRNLYAELFLAAATISIFVTTQPSFAQTVRCAPREHFLAQLSERYQERLQMLGLTANGRIMKAFASDKTGAWTITVTGPTRRMCHVADGLNLQ